MRHSRALPGRAHANGFSLLELGVAATVIALLSGVLLQRMASYQNQLELASVEQLAATLRGALTLREAGLHLHHREQELPKLLDENPMEWLANRPKNYLGEYYAPDLHDLASGNWYFDRTSKSLVYLLQHGARFRTNVPDSIKFKVKLLRLPPNSAKPAGTPDHHHGVVLDQVIGSEAVTSHDDSLPYRNRYFIA